MTNFRKPGMGKRGNGKNETRALPLLSQFAVFRGWEEALDVWFRKLHQYRISEHFR